MSEIWRQIAALARADRTERCRALLEERGVGDAKRVANVYAGLLDLPIFEIAAERVAKHLLRAGSPARAASALEDSVRALESGRGDASPLLVDPVLSLLIELAGSSARAARLMTQDPMLAVELGVRVHGGSAPSLKGLERIVERTAGDTEAFDRALRRFRNRQMLHIALRELRGADVRDTSADVADLASAAIEAALQHHYPRLVERYGRLEPENSFVVIGMGKLGGRELNFSSDVDVICFYEHDSGSATELTPHQLYVKLFERASASLSRITEHGFVFRVDHDLRPEGRRGPLANSLAGAERYYETWGRTWERAAWIRARPVAGSMKLGDQVIAMMRPFVYRKSLDLKAIEEIAATKEKIDVARRRAQVTSGSRDGVDLKLGLGGIREIEFFVQAQQLLHGGRNPYLRHPNTLEALHRLEAAGIVSVRTRQLLSDAYRTLRTVEHRVQIVEDLQTHVLPSDPEALASIARSLGHAEPARLEHELARHMDDVHRIFSGMMGEARDEQPVQPEIELAADTEADEELRRRALETLGAREVEAALANLDAAARHPESPLHPRAPSAKRRIALMFLVECSRGPSFDRALRHLPDLTKRLIVHGALLEDLGRPTLRRGAARVLGASDLLARILVSNPALLPQVLASEALPPPATLEREITAGLAGVGGDVEAALEVLRTIKRAETLRTAIADMAGQIDTAGVGERMSWLAERLITAALDLAMRVMIERYGAPVLPAEVAVVAAGTFGTKDMGYRTDVDLSVVYAGEGETAGGPKGPVGVRELFTRAVQKLLDFLGMRGREGDLYPADMRLRPSGSQGALVVSLENFQAYHQKVAQLWERQALVRARTVAGSPALRERVDRVIETAVYGPGPVEDAAAKIREMRDRMGRERAVKKGPEARRIVDLKLGEGGLVEVEFVVQYLLLQHGRDHPEIRTTSTRGAMRALAEAGLLTRSMAAELLEAYDLLRRVQNWLRLSRDELIDHLDLDDEALRPLALAVGFEGTAAKAKLEQSLEEARRRVHEAYLDVLGGAGGPDPARAAGPLGAASAR